MEMYLCTTTLMRFAQILVRSPVLSEKVTDIFIRKAVRACILTLALATCAARSALDCAPNSLLNLTSSKGEELQGCPSAYYTFITPLILFIILNLILSALIIREKRKGFFSQGYFEEAKMVLIALLFFTGAMFAMLMTMQKLDSDSEEAMPAWTYSKSSAKKRLAWVTVMCVVLPTATIFMSSTPVAVFICRRVGTRLSMLLGDCLACLGSFKASVASVYLGNAVAPFYDDEGYSLTSV